MDNPKKIAHGVVYWDIGGVLIDWEGYLVEELVKHTLNKKFPNKQITSEDINFCKGILFGKGSRVSAKTFWGLNDKGYKLTDISKEIKEYLNKNKKELPQNRSIDEAVEMCDAILERKAFGTFVEPLHEVCDLVDFFLEKQMPVLENEKIPVISMGIGSNNPGYEFSSHIKRVNKIIDTLRTKDKTDRITILSAELSKEKREEGSIKYNPKKPYGIMKPNELFNKEMLERAKNYVGHNKVATVFVDDGQKNIDAAKEAGIKAIFFDKKILLKEGIQYLIQNLKEALSEIPEYEKHFEGLEEYLAKKRQERKVEYLTKTENGLWSAYGKYNEEKTEKQTIGMYFS